MLLTVISASALFVSTCAAAYAYFALRESRQSNEWCQSAFEYVQHENKGSKTLRQLTDIEATLTEHEDSLVAVQSTLKKLRSRIGMRELRARKDANGSDIPDAKEDPAAWKAYMRKKIHLDKVGKDG